MEHHKPHPNAVFEGYYSKFDLPSGAHLAIIVCEVRGAKKRPNMMSFTYVPRETSKTYQKEVWAESMDQRTVGEGFIVDIPGIGHITWSENDIVEYELEHEAFSFRATTTSRTPWSSTADTPESLLVHLPLPLHWHVHSLASNSTFQLKIPGYELPSVDQSGSALVHDEKNWAHSFPSAHMWLQARDEERSFCCAGGQILGMEAFLLGYRSKDVNIDFRPPFAVRLAGLSPFMSYKTDWDSRKFELTVQSFRNKITVKATAPKGTFFSLSSPFPEGHRENYLGQSFRATLEIQVYESSYFTPWRLVKRDHFEDASLEFGGGHYPHAGSEERFH